MNKAGKRSWATRWKMVLRVQPSQAGNRMLSPTLSEGRARWSIPIRLPMTPEAWAGPCCQKSPT